MVSSSYIVSVEVGILKLLLYQSAYTHKYIDGAITLFVVHIYCENHDMYLQYMCIQQLKTDASCDIPCHNTAGTNAWQT